MLTLIAGCWLLLLLIVATKFAAGHHRVLSVGEPADEFAPGVIPKGDKCADQKYQLKPLKSLGGCSGAEHPWTACCSPGGCGQGTDTDIIHKTVFIAVVR